MPRHILAVLAGVGLLVVPSAGRAALTGSPAAIYEGGAANVALGWAVHTAGDVNGDSHDDVVAIAGSPPSLYCFHGGELGLTLAPGFPLAIIASGVARPRAAGDVNGDGYGDVVIGFGNSHDGQIRVYHGSASGLDTASPFVFTSGAARFGEAVGTAGDVNGDGYDDVIVGSPEESGSCGGVGSFGVGRVDVFYGTAAGLSGSSVWTLRGCQWVNNGSQLGTAVGTAGDVNADGFDDVVVSAPFLRRVGPIRGAIWVIYGSPGGLPVGTDGFGTLTGASFRESPNDQSTYGAAAITAGDVDGDGYADVAVGAPNDSAGAPAGGLVRVFRGGSTGLQPAPFWTTAGTTANGGLGAWIWPAGDVNGDGLADLLLGDVNQVRLAQSVRTALAYSTSIPVAYNYRDFATAGDFDGDGLSDAVVGDAGYSNGEAGEGRVTVYAGRGDGPEDTASWSVESVQENPNLGWSVGSAGDVNGDGIDDFMIGAPTWDDVLAGETDNGAVFLYYGGLTGPPTGQQLLAMGGPGDQLGIAVSAAGDANGDGFGDIVVGAHQANGGTGQAWLWYGSASGITAGAPPDDVLSGFVAGSRFGAALSWGDANGDGYTDVVVGAPLDEAFGGPPLFITYVDAGAAYLYLGGPAGLGASPSWSGALFQDGAHFGSSLALDGDINGDGFTDLVVGAPGFDSPPTPFSVVDLGRIVEYAGGAGVSPLTVRQSIDGAYGNESFGHNLAHAGDVNGDGRADVIVGTPFTSLTLSGQGRAAVFPGGDDGLNPAPLWNEFGTEPGGAFGSSVSGAGDVDGDGLSDVLVGAVFEEAGGAFDRGTTRVFLGPLPADAPAAWTVFGPGEFSNLGHCVANAGDVDGDGWSELLFGVPGFTDAVSRQGRCELMQGVRGLGRFQLTRASRTSGLIQPLGLAEATGFALSQFARSAAGRTRVRLQWEVTAAADMAALGAAGTSGPYALTAPPGTFGSYALLGASVTGLHAGAAYAWRARSRSRSVYFPTSTWASVARNGALEADLRMPGTFASVDGPAPLASLALSAPHPNPTRAGSGIRFVLPTPGHARLDVLDLQGRRIRRLVNAGHVAGVHEARWDGRADDGSLAGAGVYFFRLDVAGASVSRRLAVVR